MPKMANGIKLDADLARARSENTELELHHAFWPQRETVLRLLSYVNHGNMGDYRQQNIKFLQGLTPTPDITAHPLQSTM